MKFRTFSSLVIVGTIFFSGCGSAAVPADAQSTPEKVVQAFYDAMKAGDTTTALALIPDDVENSDSFQRTWKEVSQWTFNSVSVVSYDDPYVKVSFDITVDGDQDTGTDDVEVKQIDGQWWVVDMPS